MPRTWRPPDDKPMTPLANVLWNYLRANTRGIYTPADLAREIGTWHNTILNWFNGRSVPSVVMLQRIHEVTRIPLQQLLNAAQASRRVPPAPPSPPAQPAPRRAPQPAQIAEQADPYAPLGDYVRRIRASGFPADLEKALIDTAVQAVTGFTPEQIQWQERYRQEHDIAAIATMEYPAVLPSNTIDADSPQAESQAESQPAASHT